MPEHETTRRFHELVKISTDTSLPSEVRQRAIFNLGQSEIPDAFFPLISLISDTDNMIRQKVVIALGLLGNDKAVPYLTPIFQDPSAPTFLRRHCAWSLGKVITQEGIKSLLDGLADINPEIRTTAVYALNATASKNFLPDILPLLKDKVASVRIAASAFIRDVGVTEISDEILEGINGETDEVCMNLIAGLENVNSPEIIEKLHILIFNNNWKISVQAINKITEINDKSAVSELVKIIPHNNPYVFYSLLHALGNLGDKSVLPYLKTILERYDFPLNDDYDFKKMTEEVITKITLSGN
jgi:HEAT repeat protein